MTSLRRKHWPIRLRDSEKAEIIQAAELDVERPLTWAREVLLRVARDRIAKNAASDGDNA